MYVVAAVSLLTHLQKVYLSLCKYLTVTVISCMLFPLFFSGLYVFFFISAVPIRGQSTILFDTGHPQFALS